MIAEPSQDQREDGNGDRASRGWLFVAMIVAFLALGNGLENHASRLTVAVLQASAVVFSRILVALLDRERPSVSAGLKLAGIWVLLTGFLFGIDWTFDVWL